MVIPLGHYLVGKRVPKPVQSHTNPRICYSHIFFIIWNPQCVLLGSLLYLTIGASLAWLWGINVINVKQPTELKTETNFAVNESKAAVHIFIFGRGAYLAFSVLMRLSKETLMEECLTSPHIIDLVNLCFLTQVGSDAFYHTHHILSIMWALWISGLGRPQSVFWTMILFHRKWKSDPRGSNCLDVSWLLVG